MDDCLFCKIIKGEISSEKVYEDEYVYAFNDINPFAEIHILIVPKKHIESLEHITENDEKYIWAAHRAMNKIAKEKGISESGYKIVVNCGKGVGQTVMHLHYHLLAGKFYTEKMP